MCIVVEAVTESRKESRLFSFQYHPPSSIQPFSLAVFFGSCFQLPSLNIPPFLAHTITWSIFYLPICLSSNFLSHIVLFLHLPSLKFWTFLLIYATPLIFPAPSIPHPLDFSLSSIQLSIFVWHFSFTSSYPISSCHGPWHPSSSEPCLALRFLYTSTALQCAPSAIFLPLFHLPLSLHLLYLPFPSSCTSTSYPKTISLSSFPFQSQSVLFLLCASVPLFNHPLFLLFIFPTALLMQFTFLTSIALPLSCPLLHFLPASPHTLCISNTLLQLLLSLCHTLSCLLAFSFPILPSPPFCVHLLCFCVLPFLSTFIPSSLHFVSYTLILDPLHSSFFLFSLLHLLFCVFLSFYLDCLTFPLSLVFFNLSSSHLTDLHPFPCSLSLHWFQFFLTRPLYFQSFSSTGFFKIK